MEPERSQQQVINYSEVYNVSTKTLTLESSLEDDYGKVLRKKKKVVQTKISNLNISLKYMKDPSDYNIPAANKLYDYMTTYP
jgi:predicted aldo/keto reductase-like oxidoreductase